MEQLCSKCIYTENTCDTCPVAINYHTSLPSDVLQGFKTESTDSLRQLILDLTIKMDTLSNEITEIKRLLSK